jgi:hypothetical protein
MKAWQSKALQSSVLTSIAALAVTLAAGVANLAEAQEPQKQEPQKQELKKQETQKQETQKLFIEGDIVRGNTPLGLTGPLCVLANEFKRKEKVVFRIRVRDITGEPLDDKSLKGIVVELSDGQKFAADYRARPPLAIRKALGLPEPMDYFWSAVWMIPEDYPTGSLSYKVVATDVQGNAQSWTPFKDPRSLPLVMTGEVEYTK